jgi:hypothetical protein
VSFYKEELEMKNNQLNPDDWFIHIYSKKIDLEVVALEESKASILDIQQCVYNHFQYALTVFEVSTKKFLGILHSMNELCCERLNKFGEYELLKFKGNGKRFLENKLYQSPSDWYEYPEVLNDFESSLPEALKARFVRWKEEQLLKVEKDTKRTKWITDLGEFAKEKDEILKQVQENEFSSKNTTPNHNIPEEETVPLFSGAVELIGLIKKYNANTLKAEDVRVASQEIVLKFSIRNKDLALLYYSYSMKDKGNAGSFDVQQNHFGWLMGCGENTTKMENFKSTGISKYIKPLRNGSH